MNYTLQFPRKWTIEKRNVIEKMVADGHTLRDIASYFGEGAGTVRNVCYYYCIEPPCSLRGVMKTFTKQCPTCGKIFTRSVGGTAKEPVYCSKTCSTESQKCQVKKEFVCLNCKQKFYRNSSKGTKEPTFCSRACRYELQQRCITKLKNDMITRGCC